MSRSDWSGIGLAIMTINRPKNFVHKMVRHMPKGVTVRLVVGSPEYDYLERYRGKAGIEIIGVDAAEWEQIKDCPTAHRATWNYWRCFAYGARPEAKRGLLILEDDVIPAKNWEKRLVKTIDQIEGEYGEEYVLALYTAYTGIPKTETAGKYYTKYPATHFFGNQAMYYPESFRAAYMEYLKREGVDFYRTNCDFLLGIYLMETGIPLLATAPCLFDHIGKVGTGQWGTNGGWQFHTAGQFKKVLSDE